MKSSDQDMDQDMDDITWNMNLYMWNSALLFTHEIDSAFWREWELFGMPGEVQLFLVLNFFLLLVVLFGFKQILQRRRNQYAFSMLLAASGVITFSIHMYFILTGHGEFTLPVSLALLTLILIVSLAQGLVTAKELHARSHAAKLGGVAP